VFLFRTSYIVCRNDCNLTFYEHRINRVYIVMFIKHVYAQYAAEPNLHTIIYEISFEGI